MLESLSKEVAGFGVRVTIIEPGSFRTNWAGRSMVRSDRSIADYDELFEPIRAARRAASGNQLGNPAAEIEAWEELSRSTDFPDGHQIAAN
ncbi:MAG: hypothetical protein QOI78_5445 [Actinomycetota bacterium]|jgi:NAD(P)-dependent dehydrogenase (short-subunit alcohol dehydrogenase family)|nr:hypothetical protein [Actinomycetota bacterium]